VLLNNRVQRLILDGRRDMFDVSEMIEERANFRRAQFTGDAANFQPRPGEISETASPTERRLAPFATSNV